MANSFSTRTVIDGDRNVVIHLVGVLDTSDLAASTAIALASLVPVPTDLRIDKVSYSVASQLTVQIIWDATADVVVLTLCDSGEMCFRDIGGLSNNAGSGKTGTIQVATTGWASGTQSFTVTLFLTKQGV